MAVTHGFSRKRGGGVRLTLDPGEVSILDNLLEQLLELLEPEGADSVDQRDQLDPLAAMVGIGTSTETPDDPALARLLPDAYGDDPEASAEFRRYTELTLRGTKQEQAQLARATLADSERDVLSPEESDAWLRTLNDLRLALGTRLAVTEDVEAEQALLDAMPEGDPVRVMHDVYDWLGYLQVTLLRALGG